MTGAANLEKLYRLTPDASLKRLELPFLYNRRTDDLFSLDEAGFAALIRCDGVSTARSAGLEEEFLDFCLAEGLLEALPAPSPKPIAVPVSGPSPLPSLRYLELQITRRCNLACGHCYLGDALPVDLELSSIKSIIGEFERMGGLRLMISGGEPGLHPEWARINDFMGCVGVRRVLLTNGTTVLKESPGGLNFDDVQVSLDGMEGGHDALRGSGSFRAGREAASLVANAGIDLSIATQVHAGNLGEFEQLKQVVEELGAREWGIDAPCVSGRFTGGSSLSVSAAEAARAMSYAFGGSYHGGSDGMACGLHLATVGADGTMAQCGFYFDEPLGNASEGLARCWKRRTPKPLSSITVCRDCADGADCGGGCRFRAGAPDLPDIVMCEIFGRARQQI